MDKIEELEKEFLAPLEKEGKGMESRIIQWMNPAIPPKDRAIIRSFLSRLYIREDGTYFLK